MTTAPHHPDDHPLPRRPTEGQLRWAQFHHRRRAVEVRAKIEALYQRPASPSAVEGAMPEDGASSSDEPQNALATKRRHKPKVSRGRRALLRVSQRRLRARQARIAQQGYGRMSPSGSIVSSDEEATDPDEALAWIFAETRKQRRRRRTTRHHTTASNKERGKRFDQAMQALLRSVAAAQQPQFAAVETPTKIWTRPAETPLWDVNYDALKVLGIPQERRKSTLSPARPLDKGASWMVHLPKTEKISNESRRLHQQPLPPTQAGMERQEYEDHEHFTLPYDHDKPTRPDDDTPVPWHGPASPARQRFRDICSDLQKPAVASPPPPRTNDRLRKYLAQLQRETTMSDEKKEDNPAFTSPAEAAVASPLNAVRLDFAQVVQKRIQAMEQSAPLHHEETPNDSHTNEDRHGLLDASQQDQLEAWIDSMDADLLEEMEALNPGVQDQLRALYLGESSPSVKQLARIIESPQANYTQQQPKGLVKDLVKRMERAARQESLLAADGKLHKPTFAKLLNQYLLEAQGQTISPRRRQPVVDSLVSKFQESRETESIIDDQGNLDVPVLAKLVTKYLAQVTGQDEAAIQEATDWESLHTEEYRERPAFVRETTRQLRQQVVVNRMVPRGEAEWCEVVERSMKAALPASVVPPSLAVRKVAERCAAMVPQAWEQINTIEEAVEDVLEEAREIHEAERQIEAEHAQDTVAASPSQATPGITQVTPSPQVKRLVSHLERAADVEPLVQDGNLHMPTFKKLVNQYWNETTRDMTDFTSAPTPVLLARAKRSSVADQQPVMSKSPETVRRFLNNVESLAKERRLVDARGSLNHQALEDLVTQELYKASRPDGNGDNGLSPIGEVYDDHTLPQETEEMDFFSVIRRSRVERTVPARSVVSELTCEDSLKKSDVPAKAETDRHSARNITDAVTNKVGGLFGRLFQRDDSSVERKNDMEAVAAYRKKQDERRLSDDTSSLSSFRALPDGIKNVVMNFRRMGGAQEGQNTGTIPTEKSFDDHQSFESGTMASYSKSLASQGQSDFSPERVKTFHKKVMEKSALIGGGELTKGIIDTDGSEASFEGVNPEMLASLLLSPTILTKRHQQAMRAIEKRNWDQVAYLISANPWLCEMTDLTTNQYLLHKLALYGGGESTVDLSTGASTAVRFVPAPSELNDDMVRLFSSAVHKFDQDGNLPLHMACAAANASMVEILGDTFPGGATVRNEDGLLPIHLVILACGSPRASTYGDSEAATDMVRTMLHLFPASVAIPDDEGNLPIHTAASVLRGDVGVDVIHLLLDEAVRQLEDPYGARFRNKIALEDLDNATVETEPTDTPTDSAHESDELTYCTTVSNDAGETALMAAIHARAGWQIIDALVHGKGGPESALIEDMNKNNALHLLLSEEYQDSAAALTILKNAPETARHRNEEGILPIEIACMQLMKTELILAIALVDLPIDLDSKESLKIKEKQGSSWWYLVCESDDHFVDVVDEVVSMCSYAQIKELCFMEGYNRETLISRATPKCRAVLQRGLRFLGRFEFIGQSAILADPSRGIKIFEAVDCGPLDNPFDTGKRVILKCFSDETTFLQESEIIREISMDFDLFEEVAVYSAGDNGERQYCISIERPQLTLGGVVSGMLANEDCQTNEEVRERYAIKVFSVLRIVCKALSSLHSVGLVHGNISLTHVGKYETKWKVAEVLGLQKVGTFFDPDRFSPSSPPESVIPRHDSNKAHEVTFRVDLVTSPSIDVWGFGKMAFEALVGEPLVLFDDATEFDDDHRALMDILHWNEFNLEEVAEKMRKWSVPHEGINLVVACLAPQPSDRPTADELLCHPLWKELRRHSR